MNKSKDEIQEQNAITNGSEMGIKALEQSGDVSIVSLKSAKSKSISVIRITDGEEIVNSGIKNKEVTNEKINDDTITSRKSTKKDKRRTIECLNLMTKPRFQRVTTDMFRTFLTRKSMALEHDKVDLKPESSEVLELKYSMLQGPVTKNQIAPSKHKSPQGSSVSVDQSRSITKVFKVQSAAQKGVDSSKTGVEKYTKTDHDTTPSKLVMNNIQSGKEENGEGRAKKSKYQKREGGPKMSAVSNTSGIQQKVLPKKEEELQKGVTIRIDAISTSREHQSPEDEMKKSQKQTAHKETRTKNSKKHLKTGKSEAERAKSGSAIDRILDNFDNPDWADEITLGELIGDTESEDMLQIVSEMIESSKNLERTVADDEKVRHEMNGEDHASAENSLPREPSHNLWQKSSKTSSTKEPKTLEKDLEDGDSMGFIAKTRNRIFKDFIQTENPIKKEDYTEPRQSYFDCPSLSTLYDEGLALNDTGKTGSLHTFKSVKEDSSHELLQSVSTTTARLISMYEANTEPKEDRKSSEKGAPPSSELGHVKLEMMDLETIRNLDVFTKLLGTLKNRMEADEKIKSCQCESSPCSMGDDYDRQDVTFLPDQFTDDEFMKYFCKDWAQPEKPIAPKQKDESIKRASSVIVERESTVGEEDSRSRFSDILNKIEDDEIYDLIFTYRLPKTAPFDLNDTVNEVRFKCIRKWLVETGNTLYRSVFEEEVRAKAEEKINEMLIQKMISLQNQVKRCNICNDFSSPSVVTNATSVSTFSMKEDAKGPTSFIGLPTNIDEIPAETMEDSSDVELEYEMGVLMRKLHQSIVSGEDSEIVEKSNFDLSVDGEYEKDGNIDPLSSSRQVGLETRGTKRRREIRELLEKLIELLEKKLNRMKTHRTIVYKGEDEEGEVVTIEKELSFKPCHCQGIEQEEENRTSQLPIDYLDAILKNFPVNTTGFHIKRFVCQNPSVQDVVIEPGVISFTKRNRIQLYLLDYLKTWKPLTTNDNEERGNVEKTRLIDKLEELNKQKKEKQGPRGRTSPALETCPKKTRKKIPVTRTPEKKNKIQINEGTNDVPKHTEIPFTCSCYCDRVSRFNPKRNQHFRTVLSMSIYYCSVELDDHFWCLRTDARLLEDEQALSEASAQVPTHWPLCPPQVVEEPDNFQGWLADTDRNLLLLMSRSPMDRIDKNYYKKTTTEKKHNQPLLEEDDDEKVRKRKKLQELVDQLSKASAERFWETVERWYEDYKKRDKVRQMLELFQEVDLNAMLQRDLTLMKDELAKQFEMTKEKVRVRVEREKEEKFDDDVKKLRATYSCHLKNRLEAKEKEMEDKKAFLVRCMLVETEEKFAPVIEKYKKKCIEWIETLRDKQNETSLTVNQRKARELALIADKCDVAERVRRKLLGATGKEHEEVEKVLGKAIESRDIVIEGLKSDAINLTRDVNIWKRAVGEVLKSFKKFVYYILETRPDRAQYYLSLEKLYQLQMDDLIRDANNELEGVETNEIEPTARRSETLQPTMEIKCPSHDIRYPSKDSRKTGSSLDTDIEEDIKARKVVDHAVDAAIRTVLPTPEPSVEDDEEDDLEELEQLIGLFENDNSQELKIESLSSEEVCEEEQMEHDRLARVIGEGASDPCISVEEFTKRRIREMLEIIARKKHLIRNQVNL